MELVLVVPTTVWLPIDSAHLLPQHVVFLVLLPALCMCALYVSSRPPDNRLDVPTVNTWLAPWLQNNSICSLKGSLSHFKFLETLDLSNNQLRSLPKLTASLAKFQYLTFLNLKVPPTMTA